jgi:beta-fructofuranosidase
MALRLADRWLWDFWFARDGDDVHVFYLQAPRSLGDAELRHRNATIGHALSRDLRTWEVLPDALGPGRPGEFDDLATWTGSVMRHDGRWHLFYTGISHAEDGAVQRVGLATSHDLGTWTRHGVVLEADPRFYETRARGAPEEHWRDPWVVWDEPSARFHMLVTARVPDGPEDARGVIGHATSRDLGEWQAEPPLSSPGEFRQLEVPQLVRLGGRWRILFCATQVDHSALRLGRRDVVRACGTHYLSSESKFGHYALERDDFLVGDEEGRYYAGRLLEHQGEWLFFAWRMRDEHGGFGGELSDPMPVRVGADGSISVDVLTSPSPRTSSPGTP